MGYLDLAKRVPRRQVPKVREGTQEILDRGRIIRLYRARDTCLRAGRCLQLSQETDCHLFPLTWRWGWCRERVPAGPSLLADGGGN